MKILITGGSGFLGKELIDVLKKNNEIKSLGRSGADYICDLSQSIPLISDKFDIIVHCAGKAHMVPRTIEERSEFYKVNTEGTINLLKSIDVIEKKVKSFILISTVAVYGKNQGLEIDESYPLEAKDPYGHSKILSELAVLEWGKRHNICVSILRLPLIVGKTPPGNLGLMQKSIQKGYYLGIGRGDARKSMVLAFDVAKAIEQVAEIGGIYNLTDGYHPSFKELENAISKHLNKNRPFRIPYWFSYIIASMGDFINKFVDKKFPLDSSTLQKISSPLTFSDIKARKSFDWSPIKVLDFYN